MNKLMNSDDSLDPFTVLFCTIKMDKYDNDKILLHIYCISNTVVQMCKYVACLPYYSFVTT